ncbi:hypothetical protein B0T17DRAFT_615304 [Bombardia bombarda]|uniref:Enoyl reductase (ER) domain-containing protein n=1 Tax=Bombardia bombarda TaxID=252184 RepID=A0AA40C8X1_9PEZI|nr:hypothetical protein B0T17DRAFT_615304 [Bombardia bombarda]
MASLPSTYRAFRRNADSTSIELSTEKLPKVEELGAHDVVLKIHAVSLNFRDVAMIHGRYPASVLDRGVVASDCGAEVVAFGVSVTNFKAGDRVTSQFASKTETWARDCTFNALGGEVNGVLAEYAVFPEDQLLLIPDHLSYEEASTLACAGLTAWNALKAPGLFAKDATVLLQGTGGVSMFGLLLAIAAGIKPIISSSSDEKLEAIKKLSPSIMGYNYRKNPDQAAEVKRLTDGLGVDIVVNNSGPGSIPGDIASLAAADGAITMVGFLEGFGGDWEPSLLLSLMRKRASIQGIAVGWISEFEEFLQFINEKKINLQPLIDSRIFTFDESKEAFDYLYSGKHVGKVIIKL